jgi:Na+-driven multidrug efflux pump
MAGLVALLALLPAVLFGLGRTWWAGIVTVTNVIIITVSLYLLMSPTEAEEHGESSDGEVI